MSTLYVLLTMFLAEALRKIVEAAMPNKSLVKTAILEFVAAAEMCGCGFELIISEQVAPCSFSYCITRLRESPSCGNGAISRLKSLSVADNYGVMSYAVFLFLLTIWWGDHWGEATACPYIHFEEALRGRMGILETAVRTAAEVAGGILVFK